MVMRPQAEDRLSVTNDVSDLGPLAWVLDETRESIQSSVKTLKRYLRDAEAARGVDMSAVDTSQLRLARQQMHQAVGALEMVGQPMAAQVVRAMEAAVHLFVQSPDSFNESAAVSVERAGFALIEYLQGQLGAHPRSALGLFPQFRQIQELSGADRIHPADLWDQRWIWRELDALSVGVQALTYGPEVRGKFDHDILRVMKRGSTTAAAELSALCLGLAAGEQEIQPRAFWQVAAGLFEAIEHSLISTDIYVKRAASRVLLQYAALAHGDKTVSERLALDLLFFCAQAQPTSGEVAPALQAVRQAWHLQSYQPVDYERPMFGLYDPAMLAQARKRIDAIKENWSALAGGDLGRLKACANQLGLVAESLDKLHENSQPLSAAFRRVADQLVQTNQVPSPELAMETATAVLFLEASFSDFHPVDAVFGKRVEQLAMRLDGVRAGASAPTLEPWMEELYRQVSDQQTMGSVVVELRTTLGEVEQRLDQYFRNPADTSSLAGVPERMSQMRGVLSVLALDQAALAMTRLSDVVAELLVEGVDDAALRQAGAFDRLGNSLGALGFQIDMMGYQPKLARQLFVYDDAIGELRYVTTRTHSTPRNFNADERSIDKPAESVGREKRLSEVMPSVEQAPTLGSTDSSDELSGRFSKIAKQAAIDDQPALARAAQRAATAAQQANAEDLTDALADFQAVADKARGDAPVAAEPLVAEHAPDGEDELLDIFLDEAREVIQMGRAALDTLRELPGDMEQQTTLRRAFHTLKGSSRMVGLNEFGEAAWSMEQLLNVWLAEQKPLSNDVRELSGEAMDGFSRWISDISNSSADQWLAAPFSAAADGLRLHGLRQQLVLPEAKAQGSLEGHALSEVPATTADLSDPSSVEGDDWLNGSQTSRIEAMELPAAPAPTHANLIDFELPDLELAAAEEPLVEQGSGHSAIEVEPIELNVVQQLGDPLAHVGSAQVFSADPGAALPEVQMLDMDLSELGFDLGSANNKPSQLAEPVLPIPGDDADFEVASLLGVTDAPAVSTEPESLNLDLSIDEVADQDDVDETAEDPDSYKEIGDLRVSTPLYNVYLNEADEWSRQLMTDMSEWALELNRPVPQTAIARAHSLAGSSATVGFAALSELARAVEHALERLTGQVRGTPSQAQVLGDAAADIRRVLHQFAAGILKVPDGAILHAVQSLEPVENAPAVGGDPQEVDSEVDFRRTPAMADVRGGVTANLGGSIRAAGAAHSANVVKPGGQPSGDATRMVLGDSIDVIDAVDPDLFPIFEEEAEELLPSISAALRQWVKQPADMAARSEVLRGLHTLKGSARLAGALRLGEMAHRAESAIEVIGIEHVHSEDVEPLLVNLDELEEDFRKLQTGGEGVLAVGVEQASSLPVFNQEPVVESVLAADGEGKDTTEPLLFESEPPPVADAPAVSPAPIVVRGEVAQPAALSMVSARASAGQAVRVRSQLLDRMMNQAGEVMTSRARLESEVGHLRGSLTELTGNLERLREQLRDVELQAETQMQSRMALAKDAQQNFDPLEFDRFTRMQELTRMMAESVNDVATVQRNLQRAVQASEDDLAAQARQSRELQRDLLRTRMVEFEGVAERLYRVVRQASKETSKQVRLDVVGGSIEMDRGILERMTPAFEHLLRNCVVHGIEAPAARTAAGKDPSGTITVSVQQAGNDVSVEFRDDGAGLDLERIKQRALERGLIPSGQELTDTDLSHLIFASGFTTATEVTELAGRGVGMDVVRTEVQALGGRIETETARGHGASFRLVLPLTTAVTHVVMVRAGHSSIGVPSNLVEIVRRLSPDELKAAYASGQYRFGDQDIGFYWAGALLQSSAKSTEPLARSTPVVIFKSANQRVAMHVDEVLGNQEVVVKPLGPQLSRLPGLVAMTALASGAVALIYNPVALAAVFGERARALSSETMIADEVQVAHSESGAPQKVVPVAPPRSDIPLVLVVDDSITVRRVTQRLLQREGYRVALAADGLQGLEQLQIERPAVVLSDIEMPRMDGFDFVRNIRADESLSDLPVIMITSRIAEKHREHAKALNIEHYLGKPYSEDQLLGLIHAYAQTPATTGETA